MLNHKLEIKHCDYDLMSSAFNGMSIEIKLVEVTPIIESFIMLGLEFYVVVRSKARISILLSDIATSAEFDQIKSVLHKEGVKYAVFN